MKATYIRTEYVTMCATEELVELISEELAERLQREQLIKDLGLSFEELFGSTLE